MQIMRKICKHYPNCPMKRFWLQGKLDKEWIKNYCWNEHKNCKRYEAEEKGIPHPDNMLPDGTINKKL